MSQTMTFTIATRLDAGESLLKKLWKQFFTAAPAANL